MDKKNLIPKWLDIVNLIIVLLGLCWTIYSLINPGHGTEEKIIQALTIVLLLVALNYCIVGYKEKSNLFYNVFIGTYTIFTLIISFIVREGPVLLPLMSTLTFGILCTLTLSNNLSKKKSFILAGSNVIIAIIRIIAYEIVINEFPGGMFGNLLLSIILGIMIYNKNSNSINTKK